MTLQQHNFTPVDATVYIDLVYYIFRVFLSGAKYSGLIENYDLSKTSTAYMCQPIIGLGKYIQ